MNIELKKVKISLNLSEETTAFTGELWVNGLKAADVSNAGHGGPNRIYAGINTGALKKAEEYCKTLPPDKSEEYGEIPMDLELWISIEVGKIADAKQDKKTLKTIEKKSINHIVAGNPKDLSKYVIFKLPCTVDQALALPNGKDKLKFLIGQIKSKLSKGEEIFNKNIPAELL